ncbi:MAG: hypothetical protein ACRDSH_13225 [Pseudonocardiaceae bacterium]
MGKIVVAAGSDPDVLRAVLETVQCLALPQEVLERPGIKDKVARQAPGAPMRMPGPDRDQLLRLLSA